MATKWLTMMAPVWTNSNMKIWVKVRSKNMATKKAPMTVNSTSSTLLRCSTTCIINIPLVKTVRGSPLVAMMRTATTTARCRTVIRSKRIQFKIKLPRSSKFAKKTTPFSATQSFPQAISPSIRMLLTLQSTRKTYQRSSGSVHTKSHLMRLSWLRTASHLEMSSRESSEIAGSWARSWFSPLTQSFFKT